MTARQLAKSLAMTLPPVRRVFHERDALAVERDALCQEQYVLHERLRATEAKGRELAARAQAIEANYRRMSADFRETGAGYRETLSENARLRANIEALRQSLSEASLSEQASTILRQSLEVRQAAPQPAASPVWNIDKAEMLDRMRSSVVAEGGHVYFCIRDFLPADMYAACVEHWPEDWVFASPDSSAATRQRVLLSRLDTAPLPDRLRTFWESFKEELVEKIIRPCVIETFLPYLDRKLDFLPPDEVERARRFLKIIPDTNDGLNLDEHFVLGPHVDQYYSLGTFFYYMPPNDSQADAGTSLFKPKTPGIRTINTDILDGADFYEHLRFPFLPNTAVAFLQTPTAFHGILHHFDGNRRSYINALVMDPKCCETIYGADPPGNRPPYVGELSPAR